jgi:hypothetical protein
MYYRSFISLTVLLVLLSAPAGLAAQVSLPSEGQLAILCEGTQSAQGSFAYFDYAAMSYTHVESVPAFGAGVFHHGDSVYVAAGSDVYVYEATDYTAQDTISGVYARQLAFWNGHVLATTDSFPHFRAYSIQNGFAEAFTLDTTKVKNETEGIIVSGDTALVAANGLNGFGRNGVTDSSLIAVDLSAQDTIATIPAAKNPNSLVKVGNTVLVQSLRFNSNGLIVSQLDWSSLTISERDTTQAYSGGGFVYDGSRVLFNYGNAFAGDTEHLATYDPATGAIDTTYLPGSYYGLNYSAEQGLLFATQTNFFSTGRVLHLQGTQVADDTILTHVSPRSTAYIPATKVSRSAGRKDEAAALRLYPNPVGDRATLRLSGADQLEPQRWRILNTRGQVVRQRAWQGGPQQALQLGDLPAGAYLLRLQTEDGPRYQRFLKE